MICKLATTLLASSSWPNYSCYHQYLSRSSMAESRLPLANQSVSGFLLPLLSFLLLLRPFFFKFTLVQSLCNTVKGQFDRLIKLCLFLRSDVKTPTEKMASLSLRKSACLSRKQQLKKNALWMICFPFP